MARRMQKMRILHICNDYCYSKVHSELYSEIDKLGVEQVIYTYPLSRECVGCNQFDGNNATFIYSDVHRHYHKYFFYKKIHDITKDICSKVDLTKIDCIHATTLFSDGGVAYALHKKFGIPYVVAVRNTDVNEYMSLAPHTWPLGRNVISRANKLVFISPSIYKHFCRKLFFRGISKECVSKTIICPNGVNTFWLDHIYNEPKKWKQEILYIGRFDANKNVIRLIQGFIKLKEELPEAHLTLIGGSGEQEQMIKDLAGANKNSISYLGPIYDKEKLLQIMRKSSLFAMTSIYETFGLVYIEALSQGLPILYTKGQGVDGFFGEDIGEGVNPKDVDDIKCGLQKLIENHDYYHGYEHVNFEQFRWSDIAKKYKDIIFDYYEKNTTEK